MIKIVQKQPFVIITLLMLLISCDSGSYSGTYEYVAEEKFTPTTSDVEEPQEILEIEADYEGLSVFYGSNYSIGYPSDWEVLRDINENYHMAIISPDTRYGYTVLTSPAGGLSLEEYVDILHREAIASGSKRIEKTLIRSNGVKSYKNTYHNRYSDGSSLIMVCFTLVKNDKHYGISFCVDDNKITQEESELIDKIIGTFKIRY